ncbi:MAG: riboflavin kinase [Clostridia bacterium]|nr:riboflavin kinase [Clostridia bacterium]
MRIEGVIVPGKQLGRTIGFPTANLQADAVPEMENGVYAAWFCLDGKRLPCMLNIGHHPTVPDGAPTIEAHIFDFQGDIYGLRASIDTAAFLRREEKFPSVEELKNQLARDRARALEILNNETLPGIE